MRAQHPHDPTRKRNPMSHGPLPATSHYASLFLSAGNTADPCLGPAPKRQRSSVYSCGYLWPASILPCCCPPGDTSLCEDARSSGTHLADTADGRTGSMMRRARARPAAVRGEEMTDDDGDETDFRDDAVQTSPRADT